MATLENVFRSLFPEFPADQDPFVQPPRLPADVFAFSAHLLERSGASHHIAPHVPMPDSDFRSLIVDAAMRNRAARLGKEWLRAPTPAGRTLPSAPGKVIATWRRLRKYRDEIVYEPLLEKSDAPDWWMPCLELMMIADEASRDIGFDSDHPFILPMRSAYVLEETEDDFYTLQRASFSLSTAVDDLVCVQPNTTLGAPGDRQGVDGESPLR
ncbi:hypothetical protein [Bradyrhizobium sp. USDA 4508]